MTEKPYILLLGNGINLAFNTEIECNNLINKIAGRFNTRMCDEGYRSMSFPMRVIAASNDNVDTAMKQLAEELHQPITPEQEQLLSELRSLSCADILTTNYTFELEQSFGMGVSLHRYRLMRTYTREITEKHKRLNLYQYYYAENCGKRIWHIHGDVSKPNSIIMGHYYYGKLLHEIQEYIPSFFRGYNYCLSRSLPYKGESWVDEFLVNDVHIVGFGLDLSEMDLWWLICCKKIHFPDSKVFLYVPEEKKDLAKEAMCCAYGVNVVADVPFDGDYAAYYKNVFRYIHKYNTER